MRAYKFFGVDLFFSTDAQMIKLKMYHLYVDLQSNYRIILLQRM